MKKILVLQEDENKLSVIDSWINLNYPRIDDYSLDLESVFDESLPLRLRDYDIIIFTGVLNGKSINDSLQRRSWWKEKFFVYLDDEVETRKFLVGLRKSNIQVLRIPSFGVG